MWIAKGSVDSVGDIPFILGKVYNDLVSARMISNGQEYELRAVLRNRQLVGTWKGWSEAGSFALQTNQSFDKLDFAIESSQCTVPSKWEGRFVYNGQTTNFSLTDVSLSGGTGGVFNATGSE